MSFDAYQEARGSAEQRLKEIIFGWAIADAPDDMKLEAVRDLNAQLLPLLNGATRRCYDIGLNEGQDLRKSA